MLRHLDARYTQRIRIAEVAKRNGWGPHYAVRAFRQNFGVTPKEYVLGLRRRRFMWLLMDRGPAASLTRASIDAGVGDYSTFSRWMSSHLGRPPSRLDLVVLE
jgi:methylphosphotriester-DNA--protein-cysteine methyltransferase